MLGFDRAYDKLLQLLDWPGHSLEFFLRVVHQSRVQLSLTKRKRHFDWMSVQEIAESEQAVIQAFDESKGVEPN